MAVLIGMASPSDPAYLPLATRQGRVIPNRREPEALVAWLRAARAIDRQTNPAALLRSTTAQYNCLGLVFASRRTWIGVEQLAMILTEDGYRRLGRFEEAWPGDVVVYRRPGGEATHVGIILEVAADVAAAGVRIKVLSKWGQHGEYIHDLPDVPPLLGVPSEAWSDRRDAP